MQNGNIRPSFFNNGIKGMGIGIYFFVLVYSFSVIFPNPHPPPATKTAAAESQLYNEFLLILAPGGSRRYKTGQ